MLSDGGKEQKSDARCLVEAAAWRVRLAESDQVTMPAFEAWLVADARHGAAWDRVQRSWQLLDDAQANPQVLKLRAQVLSRTYALCRQRSSPRLLQRAALGIGCAVVLATVCVLWMWNRPEVFHTGPAQRLSIALADGSRVELDSSSDLRVRYSSTARELHLARGQARFVVTHDAKRPFSVAAASRTVVATGTDFDIDLLGGNLYVTLLEGRVLILPRSESDAHLAPGKLEAGSS